jgi:glycogen synthase
VAGLQSGLVYGFAGQVDGIVGRIRAELESPDAPVVGTGGLADPVSEVPMLRQPSPNGIVFEWPAAEVATDATAEGVTEATRQAEAKALSAAMTKAMTDAVDRACAAFRQPSRMEELVRNALLQRNGWESRVETYEALYRLARLRAGA